MLTMAIQYIVCKSITTALYMSTSPMTMAMNGQNQKVFCPNGSQLIAERLEGSLVTNTVPAGDKSNNATTVSSISLPAGAYIIQSELQWSSGDAAAYNHILMVDNDISIVRSNRQNGGGSCLTKPLILQKQTSIRLMAWQESGQSQTLSINRLYAIRIQDNT